MVSKNPWSVLKYPYMTEKSLGMVERENKIVFVVDTKADKKQLNYNRSCYHDKKSNLKFCI